MLKEGSQRRARYDKLRDGGFLHFEALAFSKLKKAPALNAMRASRAGFQLSQKRYAKRMRLTPNEYLRHYRVAIRQMYIEHNWLVTQGPQGKQKGPKQGKPSPFAMYRSFEQVLPPPVEIEEYRKDRKRKVAQMNVDTIAKLRERQEIKKLKGVR